jgi:hypothetical protein
MKRSTNHVAPATVKAGTTKIVSAACGTACGSGD